MLLKKENGWKNKGLERSKVFDFCEEYKISLDFGKTEREYVQFGLELAKKMVLYVLVQKRDWWLGTKFFM